MLLSKDAFWQGKKDALNGLEYRDAERHAQLYTPDQLPRFTAGYITGLNARHRAQLANNDLERYATGRIN
jgi:hypothetical protein